MHVGSSFVADEQALEVVEVSEGALDHPSHAPETRPVPGLAASDQWCDPQTAQLLAVAVGVIAAITDYARWPSSRSADSTSNRRNGREEGK